MNRSRPLDGGRRLAPFVWQPGVRRTKHSAFYAAPLDLLLRYLRVQQVLVTGVATDMCDHDRE